MGLPPYFHDLVLEPEDTLFVEPIICVCCEGTAQTAFGYVSSSTPGEEEKPTVYLADWMPTHAEYGVTVIVARGELHGDEATNMRAMAFSFQRRPGEGVNLDIINAEDTRFARVLRPVFGRLLSVSAAKEDAELNFFMPLRLRFLVRSRGSNRFFLSISLSRWSRVVGILVTSSPIYRIKRKL